MALIPSFHSKEAGETKFHNNNKCEEGNKISKDKMAQGTGKLFLCKQCADLTKNKQ
jgi:hypothetical protein